MEEARSADGTAPKLIMDKAVQILKELDEKTGTGSAYARHQVNYHAFCKVKKIAALPVTPAKVFLFVSDEMKRPK